MSGVDIKQLNFGYDQSGLLFQQLDLRLTTGQIIGLFGKNGAGKTSLLKILIGLVFPCRGYCDVMGYNPHQRSPGLLADIYYIPEDFFVPEVTPARFEYLYAPFYPRYDSRHFQENLTAFELPAKKSLSTLSYGQRKKFLIAFGLATHTRMLILDEPTHHLDIPSKSQFRKLLAGAIGEEQIFIISTHQVKDMENLMDSLIILDNGKIIFHESLDEISHRLLFEKQPNFTPDQSVLYFNQDLGGYSVIYRNEQGIENQVDVETLFNAILTNPEKINSVFHQEADHGN